jgi:purine catabolism regulator
VSKLAKSSVFPSVSDVLTMPLIRRGRPRLAAGSAGLDRRVRWVHVAEVADIGPLLRGGELVLTTGIALGDDPAELTAYIDGLADAGASGVVFELVRRWTDALPPALLAAAERRSLPVITLAEEVRFVAITEAVVAMIVDAQLAELRAAEQVHETFTALTVSGAEPSEVLREVARMTGAPVVLETLGHDVLAYNAAGGDVSELLADWAERSRAVSVAERTAYHPGAGWLVTIVGARSNDWGRLVLVSPDVPAHRLVVVAERAASALAVNRLVARDRESLERHTHRTLLTELLATGAPPVDLATRAGALGVPLEGRQLVGMAIRPETTPTATQEALRDLAEATASAARRTKIPALVGGVDDISVRALLSLPIQSNVDSSLRRLASQIRSSPTAIPVVVGVGTTARSITDGRRSMIEAAHVANAALRSPGTRSYHRLDDVRLRGLLHLLREDERLTAFAERELGPLLARDAAQGSRLLDLLRVFCEHGGNKSAAAAAAHMSRTAYYQQLARIESVLGVSLEDPESMLSLYVALLAMDLGC